MLSKMNKRNQLHRFPLMFLGASLMVSAPLCHARSTYDAAWDILYPNSTSDTNAGCALCHNTTGGVGSNDYGDAIRAVGGSLTERFEAVEGLNSDGDPTGSDNLTEINANTQPGWTLTSDPPPPAGIGELDPVTNEPPIADANGPYFGTTGQQVQFSSAGSNDPDGTISAYDWDFGDGGSSTEANPVHAYATAGLYDVTLVVTDNDGAESAPSATTASITDPLLDPIADPNGPYNGTEGVALTFDGSGSFDPDGGSITQWDWDFGDGNVGTGVSPSHTYAADGSYTVTLTVVDDEGAISGPATTTATIAVDTDGDGVPDNEDNCTLVANADQRDTNNDGFGNICDPDLDNDGFVNFLDLGIMKSVFFSADPADEDADLDGDGVVNFMDLGIMKVMFFGTPGPSGLVP